MANTLFTPEVYGDALQEELRGKLYFANLAQMNTNLQGQPGNVVNLPYFAYAGDAEVVAAGIEAIPKNLTSTAVSATVKKAVAPYELTEEELTQAAGDPLGQVRSQSALAIARKLDKELIAAALTSANIVGDGTANISYSLIVDARAELGDGAEDAVLVINPAQEAILLKDEILQDASKFGAPIMVNGLQANGKVAGLPVFVTSNMTANKALVMKANSLVLAMKKAPEVKTDENIFKGTVGIVANVHFGVAIAQPENVVVISVADTVAPAVTPKTAAEVAALIATITAPAKDAISLTLPTVEAGYTVAIKSSDKLEVIALDGTIVPPADETTVALVLEVTRTSDSTKANTVSINVVVPAKTVTP